MKLSLVLFLVVCATAECQRREYIYMTQKMTWFSAQSYCRANYMDLATVTSTEENQRMVGSAGLLGSQGWIGLNRTAPSQNTWLWSDSRETSNFFMWIPGQPDNFTGNEYCARNELTGWNDVSCGTASPFYCSWRFVLVNENKTWREALEYCRTYYTGLSSPISTQQLTMAETAIMQTQTTNIWTGLNFVNRQWVSVSHTPLQSLSSLPSCPIQRYQCGAFNTNTNLWENRDCYEKLNFLCY